MLFPQSKLRKAAALMTLGIGTALPVCAQPQRGGSPTVIAPKLVFDAASVRPSPQESLLKGVDFLNPAGDAAPPQGGLFSWNVQLPWLINFAYDLRSSQMRRAARQALPRWAQDDWFSIEARAQDNPSRDDVRKMVRSLLEDRFHLAAHMEKRDAQVYTLVVAKPGLGLTPHTEGAPCTIPSSQADEKKYPHLTPSYEVAAAHCGIFGRQLSQAGEHRLEMLNVTTQQIADALGLGLPLMVVDKTGLAGRYDAVLDFGPDEVLADSASSDEIGLPPTVAALEKQLGLKLVKQYAPTDTLVIDRIERLSQN